MVHQGYCITFKMKFETKKNNFSQDRRLSFPIFNRLRESESRKTKIHYLWKKKKLFLIVLLDHDKTFKRYFYVFSHYLHTVLENTAFRLIMKRNFQRACSITSAGMLDSTNRKKKVYNYISYTANMSFSSWVNWEKKTHSLPFLNRLTKGNL
jgi:hypothetical protein